LVFLLQQDLRLVNLFFGNQGKKSTVEIGLRALIEEVLVATVLFEDEKDLVIDIHVVENCRAVGLL